MSSCTARATRGQGSSAMDSEQADRIARALTEITAELNEHNRLLVMQVRAEQLKALNGYRPLWRRAEVAAMSKGFGEAYKELVKQVIKDAGEDIPGKDGKGT